MGRHGVARFGRAAAVQGSQDLAVRNPGSLFLRGEAVEAIRALQGGLELGDDLAIAGDLGDGQMKRITGFDDLADIRRTASFDCDQVAQVSQLRAGGDVGRLFRGEAFQELAKLVGLEQLLDGYRP